MQMEVVRTVCTFFQEILLLSLILCHAQWFSLPNEFNNFMIGFLEKCLILLSICLFLALIMTFGGYTCHLSKVRFI